MARATGNHHLVARPVPGWGRGSAFPLRKREHDSSSAWSLGRRRGCAGWRCLLQVSYFGRQSLVLSLHVPIEVTKGIGGVGTTFHVTEFVSQIRLPVPISSPASVCVYSV